MRKLSLLILVLAFAAVGSPAWADVSARQDSCVTYEDEGITYTRIHFTVVNFSLPGPVCEFRFIPEPQPALPECTMIDCDHPPNWSCGLNGDGGATWVTGPDCIFPGDARSGFSYLLDPGFCCYKVEFYCADQDLQVTQEECFCDKPVQNQSSTWGRMKGIYR